VVVGKSYFTGDLPPAVLDDPARGLIASYAWGRDYHDVLRPRLAALGDWLRAATGTTVRPRVWVDTGPVLERDAAARAGLGFIGRNTMLIHPRWGSWLFLGALLTDAELDFDGPDPAGTCGRCTRCLTACPTAAFPQPYLLDARLCISYLTIELKGPIPRSLRAPLGNRIFGCDICNEVCPYNVRFARHTTDPELAPRLDQIAPPLLDLIGLGEDAFNERFGDTPLSRPGRRGLLRNVCVALGNWGAPEAGPALITALSDPESLIRGHAAWALGRVGDSAAHEALERARRREVDAWVAEEMSVALDEL
jgi:epoxyqueuosine reductase